MLRSMPIFMQARMHKEKPKAEVLIKWRGVVRLGFFLSACFVSWEAH